MGVVCEAFALTNESCARGRGVTAAVPTTIRTRDQFKYIPHWHFIRPFTVTADVYQWRVRVNFADERRLE